VEAEFRHLKGVIATAVGYAGGHTSNPTYDRVCGGDTGHAESVIVEYDPSIISFGQLLDVFWALRTPTHVHESGPEHGHQYRSAIFYNSQEQKAEALQSIAALNKSGKYREPVSVELAAAGTFYRAEEYHQQYEEKGGYGACRLR
jgi:peptide-methionine (S)-S-oxide reductase